MKKLIARLLCFLFLPFLVFTVIIGIYIKKDIYFDFRSYPNYSWKYSFLQLDDLATKKLMLSKVQYNAFIFGSSRMVNTYACYLQNRIPGSAFYHYANWNESIGGVLAKLKFLDSLGYDMKYVIIGIDTDYAFEGDGNCRPHSHYLLTHKSKFEYLYDHFKKSVLDLDVDKLRVILGLSVRKEIYPNWKSDVKTNDPRHICNNETIAFYEASGTDSDHEKINIDSLKSIGILYERSKIQLFKEKQISVGETQILKEIQKLLRKHNSTVYVILNPLYDQYKFHESDMQLLIDIFDGRVFDFTGINKFTNNPYNYPDGKHFVTDVSKEMIDSVLILP